MKDKILKEYLMRTKKNTRNKTLQQKSIKGINTWAVPLVRYSGPFLRDDVDRLYVSRKEGGRVLASIEDSVDTSIQQLEDYIEKHERGLITAIRNDTNNTIDDRMTGTKKQKWENYSMATLND